MRGNLLNACLLIHHRMFVNEERFSRGELSEYLNVSPRQITRYVNEINNFFSDNFIYCYIEYSKKEKKYKAML